MQAGDLKAALSHARRNNMYYLQEAALAKVISGETDIEEVVRVTSPGKPPPQSGSGPSSGGAPPKAVDGKPAAVATQATPAG